MKFLKTNGRADASYSFSSSTISDSSNSISFGDGNRTVVVVCRLRRPSSGDDGCGCDGGGRRLRHVVPEVRRQVRLERRAVVSVRRFRYRCRLFGGRFLPGRAAKSQDGRMRSAGARDHHGPAARQYLERRYRAGWRELRHETTWRQ